MMDPSDSQEIDSAGSDTLRGEISGGGGDIPLNGIYRYVLHQRVWFFAFWS